MIAGMIDPRARFPKISPLADAAAGADFSIQDSVSCVSNSPEPERSRAAGRAVARRLDGLLDGLRQMAYSGIRFATLRLSARHQEGHVR
jgi:hypothetical protein